MRGCLVDKEAHTELYKDATMPFLKKEEEHMKELYVQELPRFVSDRTDCIQLH